MTIPDYGHIAQANVDSPNIVFYGEPLDLSEFAMGIYQAALVAGTARWSGGDVSSTGYGGSYLKSRNTIVSRMADAGLRVGFAKYGKARKRVLVVGGTPCAVCSNVFPDGEVEFDDRNCRRVCITCHQSIDG